MKNIYLTCFFSFVYFLSNNAQNTELIYIRIQEKVLGSYSSYMHFTYPDQSTKKIELEKVGNGGSGADNNGKIIQKEIALLLNQGYELASTSTAATDGATTTTLFLVRKKQND